MQQQKHSRNAFYSCFYYYIRVNISLRLGGTGHNSNSRPAGLPGILGLPGLLGIPGTILGE